MLLFALFIFTLASNPTFAQDSFDKLTMLDGQEHIGKVVGMEDHTIKFVHKNESLEYTYNKADIQKIQFASGRIEVLNKVSNEAGANNLQDHHNVVAVLPFSYLGDNGSHDDDMEKKVQSDCFNVLNKFVTHFKIQDPITTNAILIKHGINTSNIDGFTPDELCNVLGAEYIIMGTVSVKYTSTTSYGGSSRTTKDKGNKKVSFTSSTVSSTDNYQTEVDMKIYSDQGQNIYAKSHIAFWQTQDAYPITLQWLIKRSPLYVK